MSFLLALAGKIRIMTITSGGNVFCRYLLIFVLMFVAGACLKLAESLPEELPASEQAVTVYVPGLGGSTLATKDGGGVRWGSSFAALRGAGVFAYQGGDVGLDEEPELVAEAVVLAAPVLPLLYSRDLRHGLFTSLRQQLRGQSLVAFPYDWRRSNLQLVRELVDYTNRLEKKGVNKINLICEGTGGLACAYFLRYGDQPAQRSLENWWGAERVNKVVFISVPFKGSVAAFKYLQDGVSLGLGPRIGFEVWGSFPASYEILPSPHSDFILSTYKRNITVTIYGARNWIQGKWGFLKEEDDLAKEARRQRYGFIKAVLDDAMWFTDKISVPSVKPPAGKTKILNIYSESHPTPARLVWLVGQKRFASQLNELGAVDTERWQGIFSESGDGETPASSLKLPKPFQTLPHDSKLMPERYNELLQSQTLAPLIADFLNQN